MRYHVIYVMKWLYVHIEESIILFDVIIIWFVYALVSIATVDN